MPNHLSLSVLNGILMVLCVNDEKQYFNTKKDNFKFTTDLNQHRRDKSININCMS